MSRGSKKNHLVVEETQPKEEISCKVWGKDRILTNKDEIDYYKVQLNQVLIKNRLVGFVTDEGNYTFEDEIKRDLVKIKKEVADSTLDIYFALSIFMGKTFNFSVVVDYKNNDYVEASLYLNETVSGYEPIQSLRTFVAKAVFPYNDKLKENIYTTFNLVDSIQKHDDLLIPNLATKLQAMIDQEIIFDQVTDLGAQIYIMRTLKVLSKSGKLGHEMANEYKKQAEKVKSETPADKQEKINIQLQKVLDRIIEEKGGFEALPIDKEEAHKPMREFVDSMQKAEMLKSGVEVKSNKKEEAKTEKASAPAKPATKKAGGAKESKGGKKASGAEKAGGAKKDKGKDEGKDKVKPLTGQYGASVVTTVKHKEDKQDSAQKSPAEKPKEKDVSVDEGDMQEFSSVLQVFKNRVEDEEGENAVGGATQVLRKAIVHDEVEKVTNPHVKEVVTEAVKDAVDGFGVRVVVEKVTTSEAEQES